MSTSITARIAGLGTRKVVKLKNSDDSFVYGYASVGGKRVKVKRPAGRGNKTWQVV